MLGKYAVEILLAYGISLGLILGLILQSLLRARAVRRELDAAERRKDG